MTTNLEKTVKFIETIEKVKAVTTELTEYGDNTAVVTLSAGARKLHLFFDERGHIDMIDSE